MHGGSSSSFEEWEIDDGCGVDRAFGGDVEPGSDLEEGLLDKAHGDGGVGKDGRDGGAGDAADFVLLGVVDLAAGDGEGVGVHADADEFSGDLATGVHAGDDFLAEVAAFGKGDGAGKEGRFGGKDRIVEVNAKEGSAGFDAGGVVGGPAGGTGQATEFELLDFG